jgi:aquaporin Z
MAVEPTPPTAPPAARQEVHLVEPRWIREFADPSNWWRRVFCEVLGTFLLVMVGCGGGVVDAVSKGAIGRPAAVVAPALMVMAIILSIGTVSGAHLNPVVSVAFALRREFPWYRVPRYIAAQLAGGLLACLVLWALFGKVGGLGATVPGPGISGVQAMGIEAILTLGLVGTILGTASGAQNVGPLSALAVGGYIALAGLWSSPISGASMNPVRSFAPDAVLGHFPDYWVYLAGPSIGALAAVGAAYLLRGRGGDSAAARAAQGTLGTIVLSTAHREAGTEDT